VKTVLTEMIPRPCRRRTELAAAVFIRRFMLKPESAGRLAAGGVELKTLLTEQLRLGTTGDDPVAAERDAGGLLAMLDGLMFAIVTGEQTAESATAILHTQLDHVFGPDRR
jgi:hypothetical protein